MVELIGREQQLTQLDSVLQSALEGQLQIVLLVGEAGVGKTALITAFVERAKSKVPELVAVGGKCHTIAGGQQSPYLPFVQILKELSTNRSNAALAHVRRGLAELAPEWIQILPGGDIVSATIRTIQWGLAEFGDQDQSIDYIRYMLQYTNALCLAARAAPLLLWIDDLHWADHATLELLLFLKEHATDSRLIVLLAYRPTDILCKFNGFLHPVYQFVDRLRCDQQCTEILLSDFTFADLEKYLEASGHYFPTQFVECLWHQSGGNPLFVKEYLSLLHSRQLVKRERSKFVLTQTDVDAEIPKTVQIVIQQRLSLIEHDLRRVLDFASVQGERFAVRVLAQLLETSALTVLGELNLLERMYHLIKELEEWHLIIKIGPEYQFVHGLIQQVLYKDLSRGQRRELHLAIAQLLENLYGEMASQYASDLAIHFERGGNQVKAIEYYLKAGKNALSVLALDDTLIYVEAVRQLISKIGKDDCTIGWYVTALIQATEAYCRKTEYETALKVCDEGEDLCRRENLSECQANFLYWRSVILVLSGHDNQSLELIQQALKILGDKPSDQRLHGYLYTRLGGFYYILPLLEAKEALDKALNIAERNNFFDVKVRTLIQKTWIATNAEYKTENAIQFIIEALTIAEAHDMTIEVINCHRLCAYVYRRMKEGDKSFAHNQQAEKLARQMGLPRELHMALYSISFSLRGVKEEWRKSLCVLREAINVADQYNFPPNIVIFLSWFDTALGLGLWEEAESALERYRERIDSSDPRRWGIYYLRLGHKAFSLGKFQEAVDAYKTALATFNKHNPTEKRVKLAQLYLGVALSVSGEIVEAGKNLEAAYVYWKDKLASRFALSLWGLAQVNLNQGCPVEALLHLQQALEAVEDVYEGAPWPTSSQISLDLGRTLLSLGEAEKALPYAYSAYEKYKKIGHFLLGEAAFLIGRIMVAQGKQDETIMHFKEARVEWIRLGLTYHLPEWEAFIQEHNLADHF